MQPHGEKELPRTPRRALGRRCALSRRLAHGHCPETHGRDSSPSGGTWSSRVGRVRARSDTAGPRGRRAGHVPDPPNPSRRRGVRPTLSRGQNLDNSWGGQRGHPLCLVRCQGDGDSEPQTPWVAPGGTLRGAETRAKATDQVCTRTGASAPVGTAFSATPLQGPAPVGCGSGWWTEVGPAAPCPGSWPPCTLCVCRMDTRGTPSPVLPRGVGTLSRSLGREVVLGAECCRPVD